MFLISFFQSWSNLANCAFFIRIIWIIFWSFDVARGAADCRLSRMPAEKSSKDAAVAGAGINAARRERKDAGASGSSA